MMAFTLTHLSLGFQCAENMKLDSGFVYLMHAMGRSKKVMIVESRDLLMTSRF